MKVFLDAARSAAEAQNWYAALTLGLLIPDIAAHIENPGVKDGKYYKEWFREWVQPKYTCVVPSHAKIMEADEARQKAKQALLTENFSEYRALMKSFWELAAMKEERVYLSAEDAYALRCALCHEGLDDTSNHKNDALKKFEFAAPKPGLIIHKNLTGEHRLQLQVDLFVEDICSAADNWLAAKGNEPDVRANIANLIQISGI